MRQNTKNISIILTLLTILFISGCSSGGTSTRGSVLDEYRTGTQGLELSFTTNSPPLVVYAEDQSFPVTIEVRNKGVYPGEGDGSLNAELYFLGFDQAIITGLDQSQLTYEEEDAKTRFNPEGGIDIISEDANIDPNFFDSAKVDNYEANIQAVLCYPYKTFAAVDVCIDPNPNRDSNLDTCQPGTTNAGSQGAPITITSVESIAQKGKARFIVTISNMGGGSVIRESELSRCTDVELDYEDMDRVTITSASLSNGIPLTCNPNGDVTLYEGSTTVICKAEGIDDSTPSFQTILQMELSYGYKKSAQRSIQIRGE